MTTRERISLLARAYPRLFSRRAFEDLLREQLGGIDALDRWTTRNGKQLRACGPKTIYHICAGNLAISAMTSLMHGLLLGAHNFIKLPSTRDDSEAREEILAFVRGLPRQLRALITIHRALDEGWLTKTDAIIAFGSDATMDSLRKKIGARQRFIAHGHAVSLLWVSRNAALGREEARACAIDILTYDQLGCLSPQAIYLEAGVTPSQFAPLLAEALERAWRKINPQPRRGLGVAARIEEARDLALARGHSLWLPASRHLGWTIVGDPDPTFAPSPLHGVIYLRNVSEGKITMALASVAGRISTVGYVGAMRGQTQETFLQLGVTRFCRAGKMQFPPLTWHHDGRATLGDLITWSAKEA